MEKKRIIEKMKQLAELIHYDPGIDPKSPLRRRLKSSLSMVKDAIP